MIRVYQLEELQCGRGYDTGLSTGRMHFTSLSALLHIMV